MKRNAFGKKAWSVFVSLVLAGELTVLLDTISVLNRRALSIPKFGGLFAILFVIVHFIPFVRQKLRKIGVMILTSAAVLLVIGVFCWKSVSNGVIYTGADTGKESLFGGQRVLLLVPHQDDDVNVLGGVIQEYRKYGSDVRVVFSTNGDYYGLQETRFREAINALGVMGVPEENVIFLGYGDQWEPEGPHIYNAEPGAVVTSVHGSRKTYGTSVKGAYREGADYTVENFLLDIETVILEFRPDVIYCVDQDYNIDHRALSLGFEKVMGKILREHPDYRPLVFKGFAYNSAWEAVKDYYEDNLLSTQNVFAPVYPEIPGIYRWKDRVRLPVNGESLSRSAISARAHKVLAMYETQGANMYSPRVINSDKVFWQRHTTSLTYQAEVSASSGKAELLNDFMLLECHDLVGGKPPHDGAWIPEKGDGEKQVTVTFAQPRDIHSVVLYDHPAEDSNVQNIRIGFSDGTSMETGALDPTGAATYVTVEKTGVAFLTVTILEGEGSAGLTEIEVFEEKHREDLNYVKIMDEEENFAYDYWIDPSGSQAFRLYTRGVETGEVAVSCDNARCSVVWREEKLMVECPGGEICTVTVKTGEDGVSDSVVIRNPGTLQRKWIKFWLRCEENIMDLCEGKRIHERIFLWRMSGKIMDKLESILS